MDKKILTIVLLVLCSSVALATNYQFLMNPYTRNLDRSNSLNQSGLNISGNLIWGDLYDYPVACPAYSYLTQLNDSVTCTAISYINNNLEVNGNVTAENLDNHPHQDVRTSASPSFAGLIVDTSTLVVDSTNNRVGSGTNIPAGKFHIQSGAIAPPTPYASANDLVISARYGATGMSIISQDTQAGWITFGDQDDSNVGGIKYNHLTNAMTFSTSNVFDRMVLDSDGNVGIGVSDPHSKLEIAGAISSGTATITSSSDITDVSGVNTLWVTTAGGAVVIGGLKGGVDGQVLYIVRKDTTNDLTLENEEGVAGSQDLIMHQGTDEIIDAGGVTLVCDGTDWYDCSHAKHV